MTRFCKQRDEYSCGPVAILNLYKWIGVDYKYSDLPWLQLMCGTNKDGTFDKDFNSALRYLSAVGEFNMIKPRNTEFDRISSHLENGGAMVRF